MKWLVTTDEIHPREFIIEADSEDELQRIICEDIGTCDCTGYGCTWEKLL
jgi:hypothetical protein